jgi:ribosomal protein L18E
MIKAKKYYCGAGPEADAYEVRRQQFRREILDELDKERRKRAEVSQNRIDQLS